MDPRTPVIVGVGQLNQRTAEGDPAREPVELLAEALRRAEADSGGTGVLAAADTVGVVPMLTCRHNDPGRLVAGRLGISPRQTLLGTDGGQIAVTLLAHVSRGIAAGEIDVALVGGAEAWRSRTAAQRDGRDFPCAEEPDGAAPDVVVGGKLGMFHQAELDREIRLPIEVYPLLENAVRARAGRSLDDHRAHLGRLWSRFSEIAADNPHAWYRRSYTPEEVAVPSETNRMVGFPYTKLLCSNEQVDQGAAFIMCSAERARELGVPADRWVFPHVAAEGKARQVSERWDLGRSEMAHEVAGLLWSLAGSSLGRDDIEHVDLYSCFPSAVQQQADALGFGYDRDLTVTGGMRFAGGPWNNYPTHAIATLVDRVRAQPGSLGLCSANGGYVSKLAVTILSGEPPADGFRSGSAQDAIDATPVRGVDAAPDGPGTVETYTVMHGRDGAPARGIVACRMADDRRAWGIVTDPATLADMTTTELVGQKATLRPDGTTDLA